MSGRVYFVQAGEGGPIKIGWTAGEPSARMAALQTGNPEPLRLIGSAPGTVADERALHERFAAHRMTGEWFRPVPEIVAFAAGVAWATREATSATDALGCDEPMGAQEMAEYVEAYLLLRALEMDNMRMGIAFTNGRSLPEWEREIVLENIGRMQAMTVEKRPGHLMFGLDVIIAEANANARALERGPWLEVLQ